MDRQVHGGGEAGSEAITDASTPVRPAFNQRKYLFIQNDPAGSNCHLKLGGEEGTPDADAVFGEGILLLPGEHYEIKSDNLCVGQVSAVCALAASTTLYFQEG